MAKKKAIGDYAADMDISAVTSEGNGEEIIAELEVYISEATKAEMTAGVEALKKHAAYAAMAAAVVDAEVVDAVVVDTVTVDAVVADTVTVDAVVEPAAE